MLCVLLSLFCVYSSAAETDYLLQEMKDNIDDFDPDAITTSKACVVGVYTDEANASFSDYNLYMYLYIHL